jgi:hypothetical protein
LRQARTGSYGEVAWKALRAAERTQTRLRWQPDLKCDSMLESADELSSLYGREFAAGSTDFLHIAAARRMSLLSGLDEFWTCYTEQSKIAVKTGLRIRFFLP